MTSHPAAPIQLTFRIPGPWKNPQELVSKMDADIQFAPNALTMPDGNVFRLSMTQPDHQFATIFTSSCRRPPMQDEQVIIDDYQVNILLSGEAGTIESAHSCMKAAAAFVKAGAGGVFCDNCLMAHGGKAWLELTNDGSPDALSFAFISILGRENEVETVGMHVLGRPEIRMRRRIHDPVADEQEIINVIRYLCNTDREIKVGHVITDLDGLLFHVTKVHQPQQFVEGPMHNPFGCLQLISKKEIAENN